MASNVELDNLLETIETGSFTCKIKPVGRPCWQNMGILCIVFIVLLLCSASIAGSIYLYKKYVAKEAFRNINREGFYGYDRTDREHPVYVHQQM